jgi:hypothetical protein
MYYHHVFLYSEIPLHAYIFGLNLNYLAHLYGFLISRYAPEAKIAKRLVSKLKGAAGTAKKEVVEEMQRRIRGSGEGSVQGKILAFELTFDRVESGEVKVDKEIAKRGARPSNRFSQVHALQLRAAGGGERILEAEERAEQEADEIAKEGKVGTCDNPPIGYSVNCSIQLNLE